MVTTVAGLILRIDVLSLFFIQDLLLLCRSQAQEERWSNSCRNLDPLATSRYAFCMLIKVYQTPFLQLLCLLWLHKQGISRYVMLNMLPFLNRKRKILGLNQQTRQCAGIPQKHSPHLQRNRMRQFTLTFFIHVQCLKLFNKIYMTLRHVPSIFQFAL